MNITNHGFTTNQTSELNESGLIRKLDFKSHALIGLFYASEVETGSRFKLLLGIYKCNSKFQTKRAAFHKGIFQLDTAYFK